MSDTPPEQVERWEWDQRPDEPSKAHAAFRQYLEAGIGRSIRKVAERDDRVVGIAMMSRWSSQYDWVERCRAFDAYTARREMIENAEKVREMRRGHAAIGTLMISKAAEKLQAVNGQDLSIREAVMLAELGAKLERQARGEPGEILEIHEHGTNLRGPSLTSGDLWQMLKDNPHLADATQQLEKAIAVSAGELAPPATPPEPGETDDDIAEAEILDEAG